MVPYELTETLPQKIKGYIKAPKTTSNGNELTFGWEKARLLLVQPSLFFSLIQLQVNTISFNTQDYSAAPFIVAYVVNRGEWWKCWRWYGEIVINAIWRWSREMKCVEGIDGFLWMVDRPDFFTQDGDKLTFLNRLMATTHYCRLCTLQIFESGGDVGTAPASLKEDGTGCYMDCWRRCW